MRETTKAWWAVAFQFAMVGLNVACVLWVGLPRASFNVFAGVICLGFAISTLRDAFRIRHYSRRIDELERQRAALRQQESA